MNCADCTATTTAWVARPHNILLCDACAAAHRLLGPKVSQVVARDMLDVSKCLEAAHVYRSKYGAPMRLDKEATNRQRYNQAKALYQDKRWVVKERTKMSTIVDIGFFAEYGL